MNKVYKLIWSKVKNCWVVTSEMAKGHGKNKSRVQNSLLAAFVTAALLAGGVTDVQALTQQEKEEVAQYLLDKIAHGGEIPGVNAQYGPTNFPDAIANGIYYYSDISNKIGEKLKEDGLARQYFSVRPDYIEPTRDYLNRYANPDWTNVNNDGAFGAHSMALGYRAFSEAKHGVAIGRSSLAGGSKRDGDYGGDGDVAIGNMAWALGDKAVSIGDKALSADKSIAIGIQAEAGANKNDSKSIQRDATTNLPYVVSDISKMNSAIAIGRDTKAWGHQSVSIGGSAKATGKYALSFGNSAEASAMDSFAFGNYASANGIGAIAIGSNYDQSSDAAKAYSGDTIAIGRGSIAGDKNDTTTAYNTVAIGVNAKAKPDYTDKKVKDAVLLGANTTVKEERGIAVGAKAYVDGVSGAAFGDNASVVATEGLAIGKNAKIAYNSAQSIAIGSGAEVKNENAKPSERAVAVGTGAAVGGNSSDAIAIGTGANTQEGAKGSIVIGKGSVVKGYDSVAIGTNASTQWYNSVAIGNGAQAISSDGIALGSGSKATVYNDQKGYDPYKDGYTIDANPGAAWKSTKSALSVGDVGNNITRQITSVAAGRNDTDAVNVAQLKKMRTYTDTKMNSWVLKATSDKGAAAKGQKINNTDNAVTFDAEKDHGLTVTRTGATIKYGVNDIKLASYITPRVIESINGNGMPITNISTKFSISGADAATKKNLTLSRTSTPNIQFLGKTGETTVTIDGDAINPTVTVGLDSKFTQRVTTNEGNIATNKNAIADLTPRVAANEGSITELQKGWTLGVARGDDSATDNEATVEGTSKKIGAGDKVTLKAGRGVKLKQDGANVQIGLKFIDMDPAGWPFNDAKATGGGSLAVGQNSVAGAHQATAVGFDTKANQYGVALGAASEAGKSAVAIGNKALANGEGSIAIGTSKQKVEGYPDKGLRKVDSEDAIAIGTETAVDGSSKNATAVGAYADIANSNFSTALGNSAKVQNAAFGTALGNFSRVENAELGTALGNNAAVIGARGGVAIGAHSVANRNAFMPGYNPTGEQWSNFQDYLEKTGQKDAYDQATAKLEAAKQAWEADKSNPELRAKVGQAIAEQNKIVNVWAGTQGAVSIGNEQMGFTRQLTGVAAGTQDTDAVNVAQLKALNTQVTANKGNITDLKKGFIVKDAGTGSADVALGGDNKQSVTFKAAVDKTTEATTGGASLTSTVDADRNVTYSLNMKQLKQDLGITDGPGGVMSSWKLKVKDETTPQDIKNGEAVTFDASGNGLTVKREGKTIKYGIDGSKIDISNNKSSVHYVSVHDAEKTGNFDNDGAKKDGGIAIGLRAESNGWNSIALGSDSKVDGGWNVAIGTEAKVKADYFSTAIGYQASVTKNQALAFGTMAKTDAENGISIGTQAKSLANRGIAVGTNSTVDQTGGRGIAIGDGAYVGAKTQGHLGTGMPNPGDAWNPSEPYLPVADDTVAGPGKLARENSMAIGMKASAFGFQTTALGAAAEAHDTNTTAVGAAAVAKGNYSTALGKQARTFDKESTSVGHWADSRAEFATALGSNTIVYKKGGVALGFGARAYDENSIAIGSNSFAKEAIDGKAYLSDEDVKAAAGIVSVGNPAYKAGDKDFAANYRRIVNVAGGINDNDAVNVLQLKALETKVTANADNITKGWVLKATSDKDEEKNGKTINNTDNEVTFDVAKDQGLTVARDGATIKYGVNNKQLVENINKGDTAVTNIAGLFNVTDGKNTKAVNLGKDKNSNVTFKGTDGKTTVTVGGADDAPTVTVGLAKEFTDKVEKNTTDITALTGRVDTAEKTIKSNTDRIDTAEKTIKSNTEAIEKNTANIKTNKDNIAANKTAIGKNTEAIEKNAGDIKTNKDNIAANKTAIEKNTGDIATNKAAIDTNTKDIATNKTAIGENKTAIGKNTENIGKNAAAIAENKADIAKKMTSWKLKAEGVDGEEEIKDGNGVTFDVETADNRKGLTVTREGSTIKYGIDGSKIDIKENETVKKLEKDIENSKTTVKAGDGEKNISVVKTDNKNEYTITLAKDLKDLNSVSAKTVNASDKVTVGNNVTINNEGLTIKEGPSVKKDGIDAGGKTIANVADGKADTDAVNVRQLNAIANAGNQNLAILGGKVSELDGRVNRVGAGAAALAALHPLDFDPDDKWDFAAGYGNYSGANAVAIGAYYRPNEDTMFSVGGSFGGGENMVNAGVSVKLGQGNNVTTSKIAMAKEIKDLRAEVEVLRQAIVGVGQGQEIDPMKMKLFPDIEKNHWAYEAVEELAKQGLLEGYPDGTFSGDRMMTRYEFAEVVYRAMQKGLKVNEKLIQEFEPELERFRIDVISKDKDGNPVIERVRVNDKKDVAETANA